MRNSLLTFRTALGLFWNDRYKAVIEAGAHLVLAIVFGKLWGAMGIFVSTATTTICVCLTIEPYITFKYGFGQNVGRYYIDYAKNTVLSLALAFLIHYLGSMIVVGPLLTLVIKLVLCLVIPNAVFWLLYRKTEAYNRLMSIVKSKIIGRILHKTGGNG